MKSKILEFILQNSNWLKLLSEKPYCLNIKSDGDYTIFNYNQIESDFSNPIVREARGIILNVLEKKIVCFPFVKFFNVQEQYADKIDWSTAQIQEKVDGSLMKLWYDKGLWRVSTNGTIDAYKAELQSDLLCPFENFGQLFEKAWYNSTGVEFTQENVTKHFGHNTTVPFYTNHTYMFEMVSPFNRVVVPYQKPKLYHIGTRLLSEDYNGRLLSEDYNSIEINVNLGIKKPKLYKFNSLEHILSNCSKLPFDQEGYVVVDNNYNRVKVKSVAYVAAHHLRANNGMSFKNCIEMIRNEQLDDFLSIFPEYSAKCKEIETKYYYLIGGFNCMTNHIVEPTDRFKNKSTKEFAEWAKQTECPEYCFSLKNAISGFAKQFVDKLSMDKLEQLMKIEKE